MEGGINFLLFLYKRCYLNYYRLKQKRYTFQPKRKAIWALVEDPSLHVNISLETGALKSLF